MFKFFISFLSVFTIVISAQTSIDRSILDGSVSGEVELFYYNIDKKIEENTYATALGGFFKYSTDTNNSFFASIRLHTSNPVAPSQNIVETNLFNNDKNGAALYAVSESFIAYRTNLPLFIFGST